MNKDPWTSRLVIANISILGIVSLVGSIMMSNPPNWLSSLAFASLTGLLGYLTPGPNSK